jgi:hypothetical protein
MTESRWAEVTLPALDPRRPGDGSLWPARWPRAALELRRAEVGEHDWQSLFQQHPVARKGRVFPAFARTTHVVRAAEIERQFRRDGRWLFRRVVIGKDWGWSHPGAAVVVGQTGAGAVYVLREERHQHLLVAEQTDAVRPGWIAILRALATEYGAERIVADPSEPGNAAAVRRALKGRPVVEDAFNDVTEGIRRASVLLAPHPTDGAPRLYVSDACPLLIEELEHYSYKTSAGQLSDVPQEVKDDLCDALRYAIAALVR